MKTIGPVFDNEVHFPIDFPLDSIPTDVLDDFDAETTSVLLSVIKWPNQPGSEAEEPVRTCTMYAGVATYVTVLDDFTAGTYYAQVRLIDQAGPYDEAASTEIFRLIISPGVAGISDT